MTFRGGCHCGAVAFEVTAARPDRLLACNCSICSLKGTLHWIVPVDRFRLISSWDALVAWAFHTRVAQHYFCRSCGNSSFYRPRSHPDAISVDAHRVEGLDWRSIPTEAFDGRNWEAAAAGRNPR